MYSKYLKKSESFSYNNYIEELQKVGQFMEANNTVAVQEQGSIFTKHSQTFTGIYSKSILSDLFNTGRTISIPDIEKISTTADMVKALQECNEQNIKTAKAAGIDFKIADDGSVSRGPRKLIKPLSK